MKRAKTFADWAKDGDSRLRLRHALRETIIQEAFATLLEERRKLHLGEVVKGLPHEEVTAMLARQRLIDMGFHTFLELLEFLTMAPKEEEPAAPLPPEFSYEAKNLTAE